MKQEPQAQPQPQPPIEIKESEEDDDEQPYMFLEPEVRIKLADEPWEIEMREEDEIRLPAIWQQVRVKQESQPNGQDVDMKVMQQQPYSAVSPMVDDKSKHEIIILDGEEENIVLPKKENRDER